MFVLDDSGSMGMDTLPDYVDDSGNCKTRSNNSSTCAQGHPPHYSAEFNGVYYNPLITYRPGPAARPAVVMYRRNNDPARSVYAITANVPLQGAGLFPSLPGLDRSKMPTFLSLWQPELSIEKLGGK